MNSAGGDPDHQKMPENGRRRCQQKKKKKNGYHHNPQNQHPRSSSSSGSSENAPRFEDFTENTPGKVDFPENALGKAVPQENAAGFPDDGVDSQEQELIPGLTDDLALWCLARVPRSSYGQLFTVSRKFFSKLKHGEVYKSRQQLGIVEQWMYILSDGHQRVWRAFNPRERTWRQLGSIPSDYTFEVSDKETLTAGTQLLVRGMEIHGYVVWIYDLIRDAWVKGPDMIHSRCLYASATRGALGYVAGGVGANGNLRSAERYDSVAGAWEALPDLNRGRRLCSGFFMDGKFYVIGGQDGREQLTCGEEFDPGRNSWRLIRNMLFSRSEQSQAPPLVAVVEDELYALDTEGNILRWYDKGKNEWRTLGTVPVRADFNSGWGIAFKAVEGELFVIGGSLEVPTHIQIWAWKPDRVGPPNWRYVTMLGTFIYNCAVMAA